MATITPSSPATRGNPRMPRRNRYLGRKTRRVRELHDFVFALKGRSPNAEESGAINWLCSPFVRES